MTTLNTDPGRTLSTPEIPAGAGVVAVYSSTRINAPASLVFRTLRNSETWKDWNRWIPKVTITYQPPEDDLTTAAEVAELVRNTSIAGSVDSQITDGAIGEPLPPRSSGEGEFVGFVAPPVTRQRLASTASRGSSASGTAVKVKDANGISGAQKFAQAQEARRASMVSQSSGVGSEPAPVTTNVLVESPNPNLLMPAPANTSSTKALTAANKKRGSVTGAQKRAMSINALYGEPSVRIQLGTKMTLHCRMKLPASQILDREVSIVVTEVSRPDDDSDHFSGIGALASDLERSATHTLSRTGVYRLVWSMTTQYSPPRSFPKFILHAQRVHEIRPVIRGDGGEECIYEDWELQKGVLAKAVRTKYGDYLQTRFEEWGRGLGEFCETMGGAVERKDFVAG